MNRKPFAIYLAVILGLFLPLGPTVKAQPKQADKPRSAQAADIYVIAQAQLYEVDETFARKLAKAKWRSKADLGELERQILAAPKKQQAGEQLFTLLAKHKPLRTGKKINLVLGQEKVLLSWTRMRNLLPSPEQLRQGQNGPQGIREGITLRARMEISPDRRYVRVKFTEESAEIEGVEKVSVPIGNQGGKADAEIASVKEVRGSLMRYIPDGGSLLLPLHYRPRAAREKGRWFVVKITPRIYIDAEERVIRGR